MNEINCVIEQTNGFLRCYGPKFKRREYFIEENAPHNIIGLYSGEEDRLWTSFYETYYKSYIKRIKTNRHQERMRLMLINKYYWNVALLTLLLSGNETLKPFIENDLGITSISTIELKFNFKYFDDVNELLKTFINRINPDHKSKIECNLEDLRNSIFYSALTDENGNILVDENGNKDYFSWDDTIKAIVEDVIPDRKHPIKMLPNLPDKIKKELEKRINKFEADEFNGFIPLLDKIVELTKEQAV